MAISAHDPDTLWAAPPLAMSHVVSATGRIVMVSGQVALDADGNLVGPDDVRAQAVQVFEILRIALESAGASFADVVRLGTFLRDIGDLGVLHEVRLEYLNEPFPEATAVQATLASDDFLVEIEAMAVVS